MASTLCTFVVKERSFTWATAREAGSAGVRGGLLTSPQARPRICVLCWAHLIRIMDDLWVRLLPGLRHLDVVVRVDEQIKRARLVVEREEGDRGSDLALDGRDLRLDLLLVALHLVVCADAPVSLQVEDPSLQRLARLLGGDHEHELLYIARREPLLHLREHVGQVAGERIVGRHEHGEAVFGDLPERLGRVDLALVQDVVDGVLEELDDAARGASAGRAASCARRGGWAARARRATRTS